MNGPVPEVGQQSPHPYGPAGHVIVKDPLRNEVNGNAGEHGKYGVDDKQHPRRRVRVDPKQFEHAADHEGVHRRFPSRWPGRNTKWIAEATAESYRSSDATHLPAKGEMVVSGAKTIGVQQTDRR